MPSISGITDFSDAVDYDTKITLLESQVNIRLRRAINTEKKEVNDMMLKCPVCNKIWRAQGWDVPDSIIAQEYCCNECYNKANNQLRERYEPTKYLFKNESRIQQKMDENRVVEEKTNYDDPDFLELTGV